VTSAPANESEHGLLVVDASALVELVIEGEHRAGADAVLDRYRSGVVLVSAAHGPIESTSALRRMTHLGALSPEDGRQAVDWLVDLAIVLDAPAPRMRRVWALRDRMSAYDAAYAAAAEALDTPLITTDGRLLEACRAAGIRAAHLSEVQL
jgi:predicted nucleic acid-binding protein